MNVFNYEVFCEHYATLKTLIGALDDADASTIGGTINSANVDINRKLEYAADSAWASTKKADWDAMLPGLRNSFQNLIVLLDNAKMAADKYNEFEQSNSGL